MKLKFIAVLVIMLPVSLYCQNTNTIKVYDLGNTTFKINDAKDTLSNTERLSWLQNSALAFSENNEELFFRHPTDNYYQVWNIAKNQKIEEIPFNQVGNTPKGRMVASSFPQVPFDKNTYLNTKIWISEDLNVSFDKNENFIISSLTNAQTSTFSLYLRSGTEPYNFTDQYKFIKKVPLTNIKFSFSFHKKSNTLFIIATGDQITKEKNNYPYCGVFSYNLTTNEKTVFAENIKCACVSGSTYKYKWSFSKNSLFLFHVEHPKMLFKQYDFNTVTKKDLAFAGFTPPMVFSDREPQGWFFQVIGSDSLGNFYLADPLYNNIAINKYSRTVNPKWENPATILHSTFRNNNIRLQQDESLNVMAISPSGKKFAYLNLYHNYAGGNFASIMLYNEDEKDRVYTFNDASKYQPNIAKNYITHKESEALALSWKQQTNAGKEQRAALYKKKVDSLKIKIVEAEQMLAATYQRDIDLAKQGKYAELLVGKKWNGYKEYLPTMTYNGQNGSPDRTITALFKIHEELEFIKRGDNIDVKMIETLTLPKGKVDDYGRLILKDKDLSDKTALEYGYSSNKYILSTCSAPLSPFKWPEFKLGNTPYLGCSDPFGSIKGAEVINDSKYYKKFTDEYMNFLWKCNFRFYLTQGSSKLTLLATGNNGTSIVFDYERTNLQEEIENKKSSLKKQLSDIETHIEKGN
ncbi:MAG: hypothetical protein KA319_00010 [Ferruginibacter sp.]|nr:hypothetical protein [Ferruginibacter sp.]